MVTRVLPMILVKFTGVQEICALFAVGNLSCALGCHPQGGKIESVLLAHMCCWKCPELPVYKGFSPLLSAHEGATIL